MKRDLTHIAQTHDLDDLDDLVEDECPSTPSDVRKITRGMNSDRSKGRKRPKKRVPRADKREFER